MHDFDFEVTDEMAAALGSSSILSWFRNRRRSSSAASSTKSTSDEQEKQKSGRSSTTSRHLSIDFGVNQLGLDAPSAPLSPPPPKTKRSQSLVPNNSQDNYKRILNFR